MKISLLGAELINDGTNSSADLYLINGVLYKIFYEDTFAYEKERNITYLIKHRPIKPNALRILDNDDTIIGYTQEFIPNAITFKQGIEDNNYDLKYKAVLDVFKSIKEIHKCGFIIGDVHSRNFIYNDNGGYLIDLDEIRLPKIDDHKFRDYYLVRKSNQGRVMNIENKHTDIVKATISALSLLIGFDLEDTARDESLESIKYYLDWFIKDDGIRNEIYQIFDNPNEVIYLDDILEGNNKILIKNS